MGAPESVWLRGGTDNRSAAVKLGFREVCEGEWKRTGGERVGGGVRGEGGAEGGGGGLAEGQVAVDQRGEHVEYGS